MFDIIFYIIIGGGLYYGYLQIQKIWLQKKLEQFDASKCPKDKVILHGTKRTPTIPGGSPFVMKLETFLRMAKIPYEYDGNLKNTFGPKGKTPWISLNGEHIADSQVVIEFLNKKYNNPVKTAYDSKSKGIAHLIRILLEERMFWELVIWMFVWDGDGPMIFQKVLKYPWILMKYLRYIYGKSAWAQGLARHPREVIEAWAFKDIDTISTILGNNKFLLGEEPCEEDASLFGFASQFIWGIPKHSPYAKYVKENHPNIEKYCDRMRQLYFPDWDELCSSK